MVTGPDPAKEGFLNVQVTLCVKAMIQNAYDIVKKAGLIPYKIVFVNHAVEELAKMYRLTGAAESSLVACVNQDEAHFLYVGHGQEPYYRYSKIKTEQRAEENFFILSNINQQTEETDHKQVMESKVSEDLTRMMRFHSQRYPGKEIGGYYLYGGYGELESLADYLSDSLGIGVHLLQPEAELKDIHYAFEEEDYAYNGVVAASYFLKEKNSRYDFFARLEEHQKDGNGFLMFLPTVAAVLALLLILLFTFKNNSEAKKMEREAKELTEYLASEEIQQTYEEKNAKIELCNAYTKYNNQVEEAIELLETMPRFESGLLRGINLQKPGGTVITSYIFQNGYLNLGCYADDQYAPAEFAKILEESGKYKEVSYSGFSKNKGVYGEETYSFTLSVKVW